MENQSKGVAESSATPINPNARPYLQNRQIAVEPVPASMNWRGIVSNFQEKSKESFSYKGVQKSWDVPNQSRANGGGIFPILDDYTKKGVGKYNKMMTEREFFEAELGVNLNHTLPDEDNFWRTDKKRRHKVVLFAGEPKTLDLRNPMDMLHYKILLANKDTFAISWEDYEEKKLNTTRFVLADLAGKVDKQEKLADMKAEAWAFYQEIKTNENLMRDFFRAKGETRSPKETPLSLKGSLAALMEDPKGFEVLLKVKNDPHYEAKVLLKKLQEVGAIRFVNKEFQTEGGKSLGSLNDSIAFLTNPTNGEEIERLKTRM